MARVTRLETARRNQARPLHTDATFHRLLSASIIEERFGYNPVLRTFKRLRIVKVDGQVSVRVVSRCLRYVGRGMAERDRR